jgi:hypothetical protein
VGLRWGKRSGEQFGGTIEFGLGMKKLGKEFGGFGSRV